MREDGTRRTRRRREQQEREKNKINTKRQYIQYYLQDQTFDSAANNNNLYSYPPLYKGLTPRTYKIRVSNTHYSFVACSSDAVCMKLLSDPTHAWLEGSGQATHVSKTCNVFTCLSCSSTVNMQGNVVCLKESNSTSRCVSYPCRTEVSFVSPTLYH